MFGIINLATTKEQHNMKIIKLHFGFSEWLYVIDGNTLYFNLDYPPNQ